MGQEHTRPFSERLPAVDDGELQRFADMAEAVAVGTPADLRSVLDPALVNHRLSRAALHQLFRARMAAVHEELDQVMATQKEHQTRVLEMNFENGVRTGKLALGDTLLHVACRRCHAPMVRALLDENAKEGIANEEGLVPLDVAATDEVREEVSAATAMTELLGPEFRERDRAKEMLKIGRKVWAFWMFRGDLETGPLAACIFGVPKGGRYHAEMQMLLEREGDRCRAKAHEQGMEIARRLLRRCDWNTAVAGRFFLELSEEEKLQYVGRLLRYNLPSGTALPDLQHRRGRELVRFTETAIPEWIALAAEEREAGEEEGRRRGKALKQQRAWEKKLSRPWRHRVSPPTIQIGAVCSAPDALRAYTGIATTSAADAVAARDEDARREAEAADAAEAALLREP